MNYLLVFLGGGLGSVARYFLARVFPWTEGGFPWGTLAANFLACLILGIGIAATAKELLSPQYRLLLLTGFCGGFSTFSTFSAEVVSLWGDGRTTTALVYTLVSLLSGFGVFAIGLKLL